MALDTAWRPRGGMRTRENYLSHFASAVCSSMTSSKNVAKTCQTADAGECKLQKPFSDAFLFDALRRSTPSDSFRQRNRPSSTPPSLNAAKAREHATRTPICSSLATIYTEYTVVTTCACTDRPQMLGIISMFCYVLLCFTCRSRSMYRHHGTVLLSLTISDSFLGRFRSIRRFSA